MTALDTFEEFNPFTQRFRTKCVACEKVVYPTLERAREAAAKISERTRMQAHLGRCGHWHVRGFKRDARRRRHT